MAYVIEQRDRGGFEVRFGRKKFLVPFIADLPLSTLRRLTKAQKTGDEMELLDWTVDFFTKQLGEEVVDSLTMNDFTALMRAWQEASEEASGVTMGES